MRKIIFLSWMMLSLPLYPKLALFDMDMGVRGHIIGGFAAFPDDANAFFYNPAGAMLSKVTSGVLSVKTFLYTTSFYGALNWKPMFGGRIGVYYAGLFLLDDIREIKEGSYTGDSVKYSENILGIGYGTMLDKKKGDILWGITLKAFSHNIADYSIISAAIDGGIIYRLSLFNRSDSNKQKKFFDSSVGFVIRNIGPEIGDEYKEPLPLTFDIAFNTIPLRFMRAGIGVRYITSDYFAETDSFNLSIGIELDNKKLGFAQEYYIKPKIGVRFPFVNQESPTYMFGLGIGMDIFAMVATFNFAYEYSQMSSTEDINYIWASVSLSKSLALLTTIAASSFAFPAWIPLINDMFVFTKEGYNISKSEEKEKVFNLFYKGIKVKDNYTKQKGFDKILDRYLSDALSTLDNVKLVNNIKSADIVLSGDVESKGELFLSTFKLEDSKNPASFVEDNFSCPITFTREKEENVGTISVFMIDGKYQFINTSKKEKGSKDIENIKNMSESIAKWISKSYKRPIEGKLIVHLNVDDVKFVVDNKLVMTTTSRDFEYFLQRGKHTIMLIKENSLPFKKTVFIESGKEYDLAVNIESGKFYTDIMIKTFPDTKLKIDNVDFKSPATRKKIVSGQHSFVFDFGGDLYKELFNIKEKAIYKIYRLFEYEDSSFKNKDFWHIKRADSGLEVKSDDGLYIDGKTSDEKWMGSGIASVPFKPYDNLIVSAEIESHSRDSEFVVGIVDMDTNGFVSYYKGNYMRYIGWGKIDMPTFVKALKSDEVMDYYVELRYRRATGEIEYYANDTFITTIAANFKSDVRVVFLADSKDKDKNISVLLRNIKIKNNK